MNDTPPGADTASYTLLEGAIAADDLGICTFFGDWGSKDLKETGWQNKSRMPREELIETAEKEENNIFALWGEPSDGAGDIDQDNHEVQLLDPYFSPETGPKFGRQSKPFSHSIVRCRGAASLSFKNGASKTLLELRMDHHATVWPGSVYPGGERSIWGSQGAIAEYTPEELIPRLAYWAAAAIFLEQYPPKGGRHDLWLAVALFLASMQVPEEWALHIVSSVCTVSRDEEIAERIAGVGSDYRKFELGELTPSQNPLLQLIGEPNVRALRKVLAITTDVERAKRQDIRNFYYVADQNRVVDKRSGRLWSIDAAGLVLPSQTVGYDTQTGEPIIVGPKKYLATYREVDGITRVPGEGQILEGWGIGEGGVYEGEDVQMFNTWRPPTIEPGDASLAGPWLEHGRTLYPEDIEHIWDWMAHKVQKPRVKCNHALVIGGYPGSGKDTLIEPFRETIGPHNMGEVSPSDLASAYNSWALFDVVRINEWRDLGEVNRFGVYEHMKTYLAAPPAVLSIHEKYLNPRPILNTLGVLITTNHRSGALHLPPEDRRHYVAWSEVTADQFGEGHFRDLWAWINSGGSCHVAAFLRERDLSHFDPAAPPRKTLAFQAMVAADVSPEDLALLDILDMLGNPDVVTTKQVIAKEQEYLSKFISSSGGLGDLGEFFTNTRTKTQVPYRFEKAGYIRVVNENANDKAWAINGTRMVVYGKKALTPAQHAAAIVRLPARMKEEETNRRSSYSSTYGGT